MAKKFWILMLVMCFITLGAANAFQTGPVTQFKIGTLESGNHENYQSAFDNYNEDSNKKAIDTNVNGSIKKFESHIDMAPVVGTKGDVVQLNASLINNQNGKGIPKQAISFCGPDGNIIGEAKTNNDGIATYNYTIKQSPDKYSLRTFYNGSILYYPTDAITSLDVDRWNLTLHVDDINCKYRDTVPVKVTIINSTNKAPIVGKMVNLREFDGTFINQGITNNNGQFIYNYTVSNLPGENLLEATVNKDPEYNYKVCYFKLNVNKSNSNLITDNVACTRGNVCRLKANLSTETNKPLSNETITFYNNGTKIGENKTDSNGQVSYSYICDVIGGNYPITVQYTGNNYYSPISSVLQLHVYNWKTVLIMSNMTAKPGEIVKIIAKLTKGITGEPLANKEVDFNDYNSDYIGSNITNCNGEAQIEYQVPLQSKNYRVSAHFNADKEYSCSDIAAYILINDNTSIYNLNTLKTEIFGDNNILKTVA